MMQFEAFSHPKARDLSVAGDDVLLHVPGRVTAVFDGATDALGRGIGGVSVGRLAALAAAQATASLPPEGVNWSADRILSTLSEAIGNSVPPPDQGAPASTTAMIAFELPDAIRMVGLGDTGYRVNGGPEKSAELMPDRVSVPARVAMFRVLMGQGLSPQTCEAKTRRYVGLGLDQAIRDGLLSGAACDAIVREAVASAKIPDATDAIDAFLRAGLQTQYRFASPTGHPLSYGVLNGFPPNCAFAVEEYIPRSDLETLEIFSDGYPAVPEEVSLTAWEREHSRLEAEDPHKTDVVPAVKGSDDFGYFDDRTVAILRYR